MPLGDAEESAPPPLRVALRLQGRTHHRVLAVTNPAIERFIAAGGHIQMVQRPRGTSRWPEEEAPDALEAASDDPVGEA